MQTAGSLSDSGSQQVETGNRRLESGAMCRSRQALGTKGVDDLIVELDVCLKLGYENYMRPNIGSRQRTSLLHRFRKNTKQQGPPKCWK